MNFSNLQPSWEKLKDKLKEVLIFEKS